MQLNYQHLQYFWHVAREGSIASASRSLGVTPATISIQVRQLEEASGQKLFRKAGRGLALTEVGEVTFQYAESIFGVGQELTNFLTGRSSTGPLRLEVGSAPILPKLITWQLVQPVFESDRPCHVVFSEDDNESLVDALLKHQLDVVLSDTPLGEEASRRVYNHKLGESPITLMAEPRLARRLSRNYPRSLDGAPVLMPIPTTTMRRSLDRWFAQKEIAPHVVAEFADSALLKTAGASGAGVFPVPKAVSELAAERYSVREVGVATEAKETFYAVTAERQIQHPAVSEIFKSAKKSLKG